MGYLDAGYAASLADCGEPRDLPRSGGWILVRATPRLPYRDAIACYPLFACRNWSALGADLEDLGDELVTLSLVTDPFGDYTPDDLRRCMRDLVVPFKDHFVVDLGRPIDRFVGGRHRRYARRALEDLTVERCDDPPQLVTMWTELYAHLTERHRIHGIAAFSERALLAQLRVPGLTMFRAIFEAETVGMILWYRHGGVAYYHLGAYSPRGYELRASFALFWFAIRYFAELGLRWQDLGAGAGLRNDPPMG